MNKFSQWVSSIADAGRELLAKTSGQDKQSSLAELCAELCTSKGEAMGTALAHSVVSGYRALDAEGRLEFFQLLLSDYSPSHEEIVRCAETYKNKQDLASYKALSHAIESPRQHLFRRINMAPEGTAILIAMRKDLLKLLKGHKELVPIDSDLKHLMISWFNRGFLSLEQICWQTPAHILEKLIQYEAVHEMSGWDDLRRRLAADRRCFAFFHPALEDEPLIFVEVALVPGVAGNVQELLAEPEEGAEQGEIDTAIFYSISNCQAGLKGISFGNFLIKQVVNELRKDVPGLKRFATLSPIPGFQKWLKRSVIDGSSDLVSPEEKQQLALLNVQDWYQEAATHEVLEPLLTRLCAHYLCNEKQSGSKQPLDAVARFHLGNGASIYRLNWLGDTSTNGIKQSAGLLVNYAYELSEVERNHEAFVNAGEVARSADVEKRLTA